MFVMETPLPLPVERAIRKLGNDISLARRRRHISQASLAERMGASVSTVRRMESGDARIPIHFYGRVLQIFGELQALEHVLDTANDDIGLTLADERLPRRIRRKPPPSGAL
jgi:transcriptional regulator with XRE-family HTH domain